MERVWVSDRNQAMCCFTANLHRLLARRKLCLAQEIPSIHYTTQSGNPKSGRETC